MMESVGVSSNNTKLTMMSGITERMSGITKRDDLDEKKISIGMKKDFLQNIAEHKKSVLHHNLERLSNMNVGNDIIIALHNELLMWEKKERKARLQLHHILQGDSDDSSSSDDHHDDHKKIYKRI